MLLATGHVLSYDCITEAVLRYKLHFVYLAMLVDMSRSEVTVFSTQISSLLHSLEFGT